MCRYTYVWIWLFRFPPVVGSFTGSSTASLSDASTTELSLADKGVLNVRLGLGLG